MLHLKYAPKHVSECVANLNIIKELPKYINDKNINTICFINGNIGSGKTLTTKLILNDLNVHRTEINFTDKINKSFLAEKIERTQNTILIFEDAHFYQHDLSLVLNKYFQNKNSHRKMIIISDIDFIKLFNINVKSCVTKITNSKIYSNFIKNIAKNENIKKKYISNHISHFSNNIRSCITNLNYESTLFNSNEESFLEDKLLQLSADINMKQKLNLIQNNTLIIQYSYYENINSYNIDIKKRLKFSYAMIFCDHMNTLSYNSQNWNCINYITYASCLKSSNILPKPPKQFLKTSIWSNFSNFCSKLNKMNIIFINDKFLYNIQILKYIQMKILKYIKENNIFDIQVLCDEYNIKKYDDIIDILHIGSIKKTNIKNLKLLKNINKYGQ